MGGNDRKLYCKCLILLVAEVAEVVTLRVGRFDPPPRYRFGIYNLN